MFTIFQPTPTKEQNKNRKPPPVHGSSVHQRPKLRVHRWAPTNPLLVAGHMALGHWMVGGTTELMANTKIKVASLIDKKTCRKSRKSTPALRKICSSFVILKKIIRMMGWFWGSSELPLIEFLGSNPKVIQPSWDSHPLHRFTSSPSSWSKYSATSFTWNVTSWEK